LTLYAKVQFVPPREHSFLSSESVVGEWCIAKWLLHNVILNV